MRRTDDLTELEARRTPDGTWQAGQLSDVPLHDNNIHHRTISTGLVNHQRDVFGAGMFKWISEGGRYRPRFPRVTKETVEGIGAVNGCPYSLGVDRIVLHP